jgi:NAD(P)-dependent dehydrogenase (short-subunit alcohol dehydrogenase family)
MARMDGKVALVTGAAAGIGRSTAVLFALEGAKVVVADWMEEGGQDTVRRISDAGGSAAFAKVDVSDASQVEAMVGKAVETYGGLDYACNNAGIEGLMGATAECTEANWDRTIGINLTGVWLCMKHEIPEMLKRGGGSIVNMASVAGLVGFAGLPAYCASKGGVVLLTKAAALEYAKQGKIGRAHV